MHKLPNELLLYIFSTARNDLSGHPDGTFVWSHVCSRWRAVIINAGELWQRIHVTLPLRSSTHPWMRMWLDRSSPGLIDAIIDVRDPDWDWKEETHQATWQAMVPVVRTFIQHSSRWRTLEIVADNWIPIFTFLFYAKTTISTANLTTLSLSRCNAYLASQGQPFQPRSLRDPMPLLGGVENSFQALSNLSLVGVHVDWSQCVFPNLLRLELRYQSSDVMPSLDQFRKMLGGCNELRDLTIMGWGPILRDPSTTDVGTIDLPALKHFCFGFVDATYASRLLPVFRLCNLLSLVVEDANAVINPISTSDASRLISTFIELSVPDSDLQAPLIPLSRVKYVEIRHLQADRSSFHRLFQRLTALERLHVDSGTEAVLGSLILPTASGSDSRVCPHLKELVCTDVIPELLLRILEARYGDSSVQPMKRVLVEFVRQRQPDTILLNKMKNARVDIVSPSCT